MACDDFDYDLEVTLGICVCLDIWWLIWECDFDSLEFFALLFLGGSDYWLEKKGMENGHDGKLTEKFSGLNINQHAQQHVHDQSNLSSNNNDNLYQVMKAVEAAEATIKQQVVLWIQHVLRYKYDSLDGACSLFSY